MWKNNRNKKEKKKVEKLNSLASVVNGHKKLYIIHCTAYL